MDTMAQGHITFRNLMRFFRAYRAPPPSPAAAAPSYGAGAAGGGVRLEELRAGGETYLLNPATRKVCERVCVCVCVNEEGAASGVGYRACVLCAPPWHHIFDTHLHVQLRAHAHTHA